MKYFGDPKYHTTGTPAPTIEEIMAKAERIIANNQSTSSVKFTSLTGQERSILKDYYLNNAKCPEFLTKAEKTHLMNETRLASIKLEKIIHAIRGFR